MGRRGPAAGIRPGGSLTSAPDAQPGAGPADAPADAPALQRRLGPWDASAIVVSNVIGGGIFFVPVIVAALVPDWRTALAAWVVGGLLSLAGAMAYAELATLRPRAGAEYVYIREAFGPLPAFLSGWTSFVAGFSGAVAAGALALAGYLGRFVPAAVDSRPFFELPFPFSAITISRQTLLAVLLIVSLSWVHHRGLGPGRLLQNSLATLKVLGLVLFVGAGLGFGAVVLPQAAPSGSGAGAGPTGFLLALVPIMFAYSGWNAAAYVAEEVRDPGRNVPRALATGTFAVIAIYVGMNLLYLVAMPSAELAGIEGGLADAVAQRLFGLDVGALVAAFSIVSIAASISAMVLVGPRVTLAMARDGLFFAPAARVHPRFRTPSVAIWMQCAWSLVLVVSGTLAQLVSYTGFAVVLFSAVAVCGLFVLRGTRLDAARPFRALGYPWAPAAFVASSFLLLLNALWQDAATLALGLAIIVAGAPIYLVLVRVRRRQGIGSIFLDEHGRRNLT